MSNQMTGENPKLRLKTQIDENLKRIYEDTLKEEVPERFKVLLEQLRKKAGSAGQGQ